MAKLKVFNIGNALSTGLEETITAAHHYSGELMVEVIPIKKIEIDPKNPRNFLITFEDLYNGITHADPNYSRKTQEKESLLSIAASIKEQGIINPIIVYKNNEKYRLIAGERRTLGSIIAGKSDIQAKILDKKPSDLKISILQWIENIERSDLTLWERLKNLEKIVLAYAKNKNLVPEQVTITEVSHLLGCSKSQAISYKTVLFADKQLQLLIEENKIRNLEKAALIAAIGSAELRKIAIHSCLEGMPLKKLKVLAEAKTIHRPVRKIGRQASAIHFGTTKNLAVAKTVIDSVLKNNSLFPLSEDLKNIDWKDYRTVTDTFKQILKNLEKMYT